MEFLEREGLQLFVMTVCLHGSSTFQGKYGDGLVVTGLEKSGPEKIYRETEILTCTCGPKTALAIPARLVFLLRGVDVLWKYILFMKKARLDFSKNSLYSPRCGFAGCSRPSEDVERGTRHCKPSLSGHGSAKGSICQRCRSLFPSSTLSRLTLKLIV